MPKIKDIVEIEKKNKEFAEKDLEKAKLPNVIRLLAKQVGYNEAIDVYGNKSIGLDVGKMKEALKGKYDLRHLSSLDRGLIVEALKQAEGEIICEVKD